MNREAAIASLGRLQSHLESILRIVTDRKGLSNLALIDSLTSPESINLDEWIVTKHPEKLNSYYKIPHEMENTAEDHIKEIILDKKKDEKKDEQKKDEEKILPTNQQHNKTDGEKILLVDDSDMKKSLTESENSTTEEIFTSVDLYTDDEILSSGEKNTFMIDAIDKIITTISAIAKSILTKIKEILSAIASAASFVWENITNFVRWCYNKLRSCCR